jgi:Rps23 Pro-64 3,4-dihydroxylase Tpa1-like proline 4-hydroxylase
MDYIVIDNVLTPSHCGEIESICRNYLSYRYSASTVDKSYSVDGNNYSTYVDENTFDVGHFCCLVTDTNGNVFDKSLFSLLLPIFHKAKDELPELNLLRISRLKVNLLLKQDSAPDYHYNIAHHDIAHERIKHYSMVYYLNDSDGDTHLFQEYTNDDRPVKSLTPFATVSPKKNRLVIFDSNRLHASSNPKLSTDRFVINFVVEAR